MDHKQLYTMSLFFILLLITAEGGNRQGVDKRSFRLLQAEGKLRSPPSQQSATTMGRVGEWPTQWSQSLVITVPKISNL